MGDSRLSKMLAALKAAVKRLGKLGDAAAGARHEAREAWAECGILKAEIERLKETLRAVTDELDSETRWAKDYHDEAVALAAEIERLTRERDEAQQKAAAAERNRDQWSGAAENMASALDRAQRAERERDERTAEVVCLENQIEEWQCATGLVTVHPGVDPDMGDPSGVTPEMLEQDRWIRDREVTVLRGTVKRLVAMLRACRRPGAIERDA